jgi:hypothetical protein
LRLITGWQEEIRYPTAQEIEITLKDAPGGVNSFVILEKDPKHFIQVAIDQGKVVCLEYQEGGSSNHFRSTSDVLPLEVIQQVFLSFLSGGEDWRDLVNWEHQKIQREVKSKTGKPSRRKRYLWILSSGLLLLGGLITGAFSSNQDATWTDPKLWAMVIGLFIFLSLYLVGLFFLLNRATKKTGG